MKLITTNDYLLLVDEEGEIKTNLWSHLKVGDSYYSKIRDEVTELQPKEKGYDPSGFILIAYRPLTDEAKELDLPWLPPFKEDEFSKYYQIVFDYVNSGIRNFGAMMGLYKLKEIAQSKQFSLEDVKKAIDMARETYLEADPEGGNEEWVGYTEEQIIQSLSNQKLPSEFIPEENYGDGALTKYKTIKNSEGKEEIKGKYVY